MLGKATRPGFHTVTPYLIVRELQPMVDFLQAAFGATLHFQTTGAAGGTHTEMRIGDSMIMLSGGEKGEVREPMPTMIFLYLEDVDGTYQAALDAGATTLMEPADGAFGEPRGAGITDISGNQWFFANWADRSDAPPPYIEPENTESENIEPATISTATFVEELFVLLQETFEEHKGRYLDNGDSLFLTLANISAAEASIPVGGRCATPAAQVDHTRYYLDVLEVYMLGKMPTDVDWHWIWENVGSVTEAEWQAIQDKLRASYTRIKSAMEAIEHWDNDDAIGAAMSMVVHTAYHLGEIRQALCVLKG